MSGSPQYDSRIGRTVGFLLGLCGAVASVLADGRPEGLAGWLFLAAAGVATGLVAAGAGHWLPRLLSGVSRLWRERVIGRRELLRRLLQIGAALTTVSAVGAMAVLVVPWATTTIRLARYGCPHPVELRVLASPGSEEPVRQAADAYERQTARDNRGCPTASLFVYAAPVLEIRDALRAGWPDEELVHSPRPDVWIADAGVETADVLDYGQSALRRAQVDQRRIAVTPLVLAVPESAADQLRGQLGNAQPTWSRLSTLVMGQERQLLRPEPELLLVGRVATAAAYRNLVSDLEDPTEADRQLAGDLERHLQGSAQQGGYLTDDVDAMLCRYRAQVGIQPEAAIMLTEADWLRYNAGEAGVGARCGQSPTPLVAFYPEDTLLLDQTFVRFDWAGEGPRQRAAERFGDWLESEDGQRALVAGPPPAELVVGATAVGDLPTVATMDSATALRRAASPNGRLLVLLDTSGSMDELAGGQAAGRRIEVAARAVSATLDLMIPGDAYGLWTFPGGDGGAVTRQVPIAIAPENATIDQHRRATAQALDEVAVEGQTPLFQAILEGTEALRDALRAPDDDRRTALVVITDGDDTGGGPSVDALVETMRAADGPQVFAIAVGEAACTGQLQEITNAGRGRCYPASFDAIDRTLRSIAAVIWRGGGGPDQ